MSKIINTRDLDVSLSALEEMTEIQRITDQCWNVFGSVDWSYLNCGQSGYTEREIRELTGRGAILCRVHDIDNNEFDILVFNRGNKLTLEI